MGEGKISKRSFSAIIPILGSIGNVLVNPSHDAWCHAACTSVKVFSGDEFSQPETAECMLGGMSADLAQHCNLSIADSSQNREGARRIVHRSLPRISRGSQQKHQYIGEGVLVFELNAPIAPNRAIPIVFLGYENFYPNFFWIDGRKFLIQNMFVARLEHQIKKKNRVQSQHRQTLSYLTRNIVFQWALNAFNISSQTRHSNCTHQRKQMSSFLQEKARSSVHFFH